MNKRVRIGTCAGPAEAALVRSVFDAHDIQVLINAEHHAGMLAGLGGAFVRLDIFVDEDDGEQAAALLADIRAGDHTTPDEPDEAPPASEDSDRDADAEGVWARERASMPPGAPARASIVVISDRRRRIGRALLAATLIGFGAGHASTGAWLRAALLAAAQVAAIVAYTGFTRGGLGGAATAAAVIGVRFVDVVGAVWRIWASPARPAAGA